MKEMEALRNVNEPKSSSIEVDSSQMKEIETLRNENEPKSSSIEVDSSQMKEIEALRSENEPKSISIEVDNSQMEEIETLGNENEPISSCIAVDSSQSSNLLNELKDINDEEVIFIHDYGRRESSDSDEDSDSSLSVLSIASSKSCSSLNSIGESEGTNISGKKKTKTLNNATLNKTPGELGLEDLPPIEDLHITVPENDIRHIGKVSSIVHTQVIVQSFENERPLDLDSVLFLKDGTALGKIFDVFGRVSAPFYSVRFNSEDDIKDKAIDVNWDVYCAPTHQDVTNFVFTEELLTQKGSDASWKDNNEPPDECLEFSDDEQERYHKMKLKAKRKGEDCDLLIVHSSVNKKNSRTSNNRNRGGNKGAVVRPNRFSAPTPDLNSMAFQQNRFNQNSQIPSESFQLSQSNNMWGNVSQQTSGSYNPAWVPNPFTFGSPSPLFNNSPLTVHPAYYSSGSPYGNYFQPNANSQAQLWQTNPPPGPNFGQQHAPIGLQSVPQNPFITGEFQTAERNQLFNICFNTPPPPPPPPN